VHIDNTTQYELEARLIHPSNKQVKKQTNKEWQEDSVDKEKITLGTHL
jgi:hypothetical protein